MSYWEIRFPKAYTVLRIMPNETGAKIPEKKDALLKYINTCNRLDGNTLFYITDVSGYLSNKVLDTSRNTL